MGSDEFDSKKGWISMDSPLAKALLKHSIDDEVKVNAPGGQKTYWVVGVRYEMN